MFLQYCYLNFSIFSTIDERLHIIYTTHIATADAYVSLYEKHQVYDIRTSGPFLWKRSHESTRFSRFTKIRENAFTKIGIHHEGYIYSANGFTNLSIDPIDLTD